MALLVPAKKSSSTRQDRQNWAKFIALALRELPNLGSLRGGPSRSTYDSWQTMENFPGRATAQRAVTDIWEQLNPPGGEERAETVRAEMNKIFPVFGSGATQKSLITWVGSFIDEVRLAERRTRARSRMDDRAKRGRHPRGESPLPSALPHRSNRPATHPSLSWLSIPDLDWREGAHGMAALLRAEARAVPFHGRSQSEALPDLLFWCDSGEDRAFRAYAGPGGFGKTRLGLSLCDTLKSQAPRWAVGFLQEKRFEQEPEVWAGLPKNCEGILVVIDYAADVAKTAAITRLLGALDACPIRRQRILFLEREHLWVGRLLRHAAARIALERAVFERDSFKVALRPVVSTPASRADSFERAQDAFATRMGVRPHRGSKPQFDKKLYDQVLLLHTQALLSVVGPVAASREDSILTQLLERERDYWQRLSTARGMGRDMLPVIEQVCRLITLHRGVGSIEEGFDVTLDDEALSELAPIPRREVLALLRECYPSGPSGIGPLEPDLLGQKLVTLPPTLRRRKKP